MTDDPEYERQLALLNQEQRRIALREILNLWDAITTRIAGERMDAAARWALLDLALDEHQATLEAGIPDHLKH